MSKKRLHKPANQTSKRKFNVSDIDRYLRAQLQTPMEAQQRQLSKERRFEATVSNERKRTADSKEKRSTSKDANKTYFVAKAYRASSKGSLGQSGSACNSLT